MNLKDTLAYVLVIFTLTYCAGITVALLVGCTFQEVVKDIILIILTWLISKSGGIYDFFYGTSVGSEEKTKLLSKAPPVGTCCHTHDETDKHHAVGKTGGAVG